MDLSGAGVLVVDDDAAILDNVCEAVLDLGCSVRRAGDGRQAQELLREKEPSLLITDYWMPKLDGLALIAWCRNEGMRMPVILMSADLRASAAQAAARYPASFLPKPFDLDGLREAMLGACGDASPAA